MGTFFTTFPICMSGTILCVTSVDRHINVVCKRYTTISTNKSLTIIIILVTLISFVWAIFDAQLKGKLEIKAVAQFYIILSAYTETVIATGVVFNIAMLKNVKQKTQNSTLQQSLDSSLTKTIAIIVAVMLAAYLPIIVMLNITSFAILCPTDINFFKKVANDFRWSLVPCQINAILNSVIYLARNGRIRRYYYKIFTDKNERKKVTNGVSPMSTLNKTPRTSNIVDSDLTE